MSYTERFVRPPSDISITELMLSGLLCEDDIRQDGTVNEIIRQTAEVEYLRLFNNRPRRRRRRNRPHSAHSILGTADNVRDTERNMAQAIRPQTAQARIECTSMQDTEVFAFPKCCICFTSERQIALVPCFHFCVCQTCASRIGACPLCRAPIDYFQRIWV